ncbi:SPW repeat protein [Microbispora sp. ATCC PTA-5024]|uniref:SPW repeat protein n=1 Tax=Microbispora sp. ATCC PTA-5024 TaxID=316330 RepID=UPI0003DDA892|nr:SPW repeat protein [Microbispora sp. ATCC PTA-5024]ETK37464.1 membrane protein [Microbispora sp. ATCC PTA-5024]
MSHSADIGTHPDIMQMRARYDTAAANPAAQLADGLTLLSGMYLALSPWIVGFDRMTPLTVNNLITGIVVALLALGYSSAFGRTYGISWVAPVIGLWTIVAPWIIRGGMATTGTIVNNVIVGALILILGLATMRFGMMERGRPGGFRSAAA